MPKLVMQKDGMGVSQMTDLFWVLRENIIGISDEDYYFIANASVPSKNVSRIGVWVLFWLASKFDTDVLMESDTPGYEAWFPFAARNMIWDETRNGVLFYGENGAKRVLERINPHPMNEVRLSIESPELTYVFEGWTFDFYENVRL